MLTAHNLIITRCLAVLIHTLCGPIYIRCFAELCVTVHPTRRVAYGALVLGSIAYAVVMEEVCITKGLIYWWLNFTPLFLILVNAQVILMLRNAGVPGGRLIPELPMELMGWTLFSWSAMMMFIK